MKFKNKIDFFTEKKVSYFKITLLLLMFMLSINITGLNSNNNDVNSSKAMSNNIKSDNMANININAKISQLTGYKVDFKGYIGGNLSDDAQGVVVDQNENIYVVGYTYSYGFPTKNAWEATFGGNTDVFVAKFSQNGNLLWSTFLGGSNYDVATGIALDSNNNVIISGYTTSINFPTLNGYQSQNLGSYDGFLAKFDTDGKLLFSTYIGGYGDDFANAVSVNKNNEIFVVGQTKSADFPLKNAWYSSSFTGTEMSFVSKYDSQGVLISNTLIGGNNIDVAYCISSDSNGNIYIAGETSSTDFPMVNSYQNSLNGSYDGFVSEFNSTGQLVFSTYFGGSASDIIYGIAVHSNKIDVAGATGSTNFPTKNAFNAVYGGGIDDAFVVQLTNTGSLDFSSYIAGNTADLAFSVSVDSNGNIYISGDSDSSSFQVKDALQDTNKGYMDMFIAKVGSNGSLIFNTLLGGIYDDIGKSITVSPHNNIVVAGSSASDGLGSSNAYYTNTSGGGDAFIIKLTDLNTPQPTSTTSPAGQNTEPTTVTVTESANTTETGGVDQQIFSNPIFSGAIGLMILSMLLNTVLLFRKK